MRKLVLLIHFCFTPLLISCVEQDPNIRKSGEDELIAHELGHKINREEQVFQDVVYVPIYSDIYIDQQTPKSLLSATLSIRNTSYEDSLFVSKIDYFNTGGDKVKSYIENPISLPPMATINYVIEKDDDTGGNGANFIVELSSKNINSKPLIQAIMIGQNANQAFSFVTNGYSVGE